MSLIPPATRAAMRTIHSGAVQQEPATLAFRRGATTIAAQAALLAVHNREAAPHHSASGAEIRVDAIVHGLPEMDIRVGDRFNAGGVLFRVEYIRPDRSIGTIAEAVIST